jgi:hypothetical protein
MASLQSLSSAVLDSAKRKTKHKNTLHFLTFFCAALSIFLKGHWLYVLATIALLSELYSWFMSLSIESKKSLGQEILRLNILQQAFGSNMAVDIAYLKSKVSKKEYSKAEKFENQAYYATENPEPEKRLVDIIQESCFWSQHLYQSCKSRAVVFSIFIAVLIIFLAITGLTLIDTDSNYSIPRLSILFLTFVPLWSAIESAVSFSSAANKLKSIDQRLSNINYEQSSILSIFAEYNVVTSNTPLISQKIYESEQDKLNDLWEERVGGETL